MVGRFTWGCECASVIRWSEDVIQVISVYMI